MSFPLRLTADLAFALAARSFARGDGHPPIFRLSCGELFRLTESPRHSRRERKEFPASDSIAALPSRYQTPIVWIAGGEPLDHPEVARFTNALAASGRHVFLEASGASLKPRLHEFQPSSHFYFVIRFPSVVPSAAEAGSTREAFGAACEAVRMARLAGFFTWAQLLWRQDTVDFDLEQVHAEVRKLEVDDCVITSGTSGFELTTQAHQLRRRLLSHRCALLSSLLDSQEPLECSRITLDAERLPLPESRRESLGEGAEAS